MEKSLNVNINVPLRILEIDGERRVMLLDVQIGVVRESEDGWSATITHFPKTLRIHTSHDNLHTTGATADECASNMIIKVMNIMLNRYRFEKISPESPTRIK